MSVWDFSFFLFFSFLGVGLLWFKFLFKFFRSGGLLFLGHFLETFILSGLTKQWNVSSVIQGSLPRIVLTLQTLLSIS